MQTKDYIVQMLREDIFSGVLRNGEELTQELLAEKLNVSRMPVREALQQLELEGVVQRLPNRHMRVLGLSADAVRQNFAVLAAVTCEVADILLRTGKNLQPIQEALLYYEAATPQQGSLVCADRELEFHRQLATCLGNPFLSRVHEMLIAGYFYYVLRKIPRNWKNTVRQLKNVGLALDQGDADAAKAALCIYFEDMLQMAIGGMERELLEAN